MTFVNLCQVRPSRNVQEEGQGEGRCGGAEAVREGQEGEHHEAGVALAIVVAEVAVEVGEGVVDSARGGGVEEGEAEIPTSQGQEAFGGEDHKKAVWRSALSLYSNPYDQSSMSSYRLYQSVCTLFRSRICIWDESALERQL